MNENGMTFEPISLAERVRSDLYSNYRWWLSQSPSNDTTNMPVVELSRDEWDALRMDWMMSDGDPPYQPDSNGCFYWRGIPLRVKAGTS